MKVLFAVSSENISEAIIKRYQKEYKEILSYKNVYYFNAILKEIQKDKTYDRIVISEDLEPFSNNNYETIDKFIFEKLDSISDEANDSTGKETSIILICTDRRQKGNAILVKLFGIGVYNALLGNDRSMEEVCKLINRPRTKKEAKIYYRIDTDDVNYKAENENEVSEVEIQNILAHFKKLGKNTSKYSDSFNNIAVQYNDEQLRIIVNCLPINVKAILESNCERYQELMAVTGGIPSVKNMMSSTGNIESAVKKEFSSRNVGQAGNITKPIVIPSAVRNAKNQSQVQKKSMQPTTQNMQTINRETVQRPVVRPSVQETTAQSVQRQAIPNSARTIRTAASASKIQGTSTQGVPQDIKARPVPQAKTHPEPVVDVEDDFLDENMLPGFEEEVVAEKTPTVKSVEAQVMTQTTGFQRPRRPVPGVSRTVSPVQSQVPVQPTIEDDILDENILPGFEDDNSMLPEIETETVQDNNLDVLEESALPEFKEVPQHLEKDQEDTTVKRGRGRPRKTPIEGAVVKPKGKRGRPRKVQDVERIDEVDDSTILPGMEFDSQDEFVYDEPVGDGVLPGFEDDYAYETEDSILPGIEEDAEAQEYVDDEATILPGMGFEDEAPISEDEISEDEILPGFEEEQIVEEPVLEEEYAEDDYTDEVALPGLDGLDDIDDVNNDLDHYEEVYQEDTGMLPGFEDGEQYEEVEDSSDLLPGIGGDYEEETITEVDPILGFNNTVEDDGLLPGIGGFDGNHQDSIQTSFSENLNSNIVESIKPRVDYSMSSLNSLITKDKKIVSFIGTSKNGVSFLVNNLAALFSSLGINTAVLDMTKNKNSYYIYTKNEEELRNIAFNSIEKLQNGYAEGIKVDKNLTIYTALPNDGKDYSNAEPILSTLVQNHSLILIDCDYDTDLTYFASCQEMYLVQSMDILTIQPLTAFLRELKTRGILEPEKIRVVVNKELKVKSLSIKAIIGGLSYYNDPAMSFMTELFNKDMVKACTIPFEDNAYSKYLEGIVNCNISLNGFSKAFLSKLKVLGDMVYPLTSKQTYGKGQMSNYNQNAFSSSMNDTLNKMRKKY